MHRLNSAKERAQNRGQLCWVQSAGGNSRLALTRYYNEHPWALVFVTCTENFHLGYLNANVMDCCLYHGFWRLESWDEDAATMKFLAWAFLLGGVFRETSSLLSFSSFYESIYSIVKASLNPNLLSQAQSSDDHHMGDQVNIWIWRWRYKHSSHIRNQRLNVCWSGREDTEATHAKHNTDTYCAG